METKNATGASGSTAFEIKEDVRGSRAGEEKKSAEIKAAGEKDHSDNWYNESLF